MEDAPAMAAAENTPGAQFFFGLNSSSMRSARKTFSSDW